jgi:hypothetical protein
MGRRRLVGEKIFTAPSQGGEEQEEETEDAAQSDPMRVTQLQAGIIAWTTTYPIQRHKAQLMAKYVYQKIFVLQIQVLASAPKDVAKTNSIWEAARSIVIFEMGRIYVCEAIMLVVFLRLPYKDKEHTWELQAIRGDLDIDALWGDVLKDQPNEDVCRTYIVNAFDFEARSAETTPVSKITPLLHFHSNLISPLIELASEADSQMMSPHTCHHLVLLAVRLWDSLPHTGEQIEKDRLEADVRNRLIYLNNSLLRKIRANQPTGAELIHQSIDPTDAGPDQTLAVGSECEEAIIHVSDIDQRILGGGM